MQHSTQKVPDFHVWLRSQCLGRPVSYVLLSPPPVFLQKWMERRSPRPPRPPWSLCTSRTTNVKWFWKGEGKWWSSCFKRLQQFLFRKYWYWLRYRYQYYVVDETMRQFWVCTAVKFFLKNMLRNVVQVREHLWKNVIHCIICNNDGTPDYEAH